MSGLEIRLHAVRLSEVDANGFIGLQFDAFGEQDSGLPAVEVHHQFGFSSQPRDPDTDGAGNPLFACNAFVGWDGQEAHAWLAADPRYVKQIPKHGKGGSAQYGVTKHGGTAVSFASFDGETGGYTIYVPEFDGSGGVTGAYAIAVDPTQRTIQVIHPDGFAQVIDKNGITLRADGATWAKLGPGRFEVVANAIVLRGVVSLGANAEAGVPLLPGVATQPTPSVFFSPT